MDQFARLKFCLPLLALLPLACGAASDPFKHTREKFKDAYAKVATAPLDQQGKDSEGLRNYPLYAYLQAARIKRALAESTNDLGAADQRAETFITRYPREPVGRDMRNAWLSSLATRMQWQKFLEHYKDESAGDSLRCQSFTARLALGQTEDLELDVARQWLTPSSLPDCEPAFTWLRNEQALTPELIEQRVRRALETNNATFAKQIAVQLSPERSGPLLRWAALIETPA